MNWKTLPAVLAAATAPACSLFQTAPAEPDYGRPLAPGAAALIELGPDERRPDMRGTWTWPEREELVPALERSISWTRSKHSEQFFPIAGITHERALASLERFRELLDEARNADEFAAAFEDEFAVYKSAGWDGRGGGVLFTGYCTPLLPGAWSARPGIVTRSTRCPKTWSRPRTARPWVRPRPRDSAGTPIAGRSSPTPATVTSRSSGSPIRWTPTSPT